MIQRLVEGDWCFNRGLPLLFIHNHTGPIVSKNSPMLLGWCDVCWLCPPKNCNEVVLIFYLYCNNSSSRMVLSLYKLNVTRRMRAIKFIVYFALDSQDVYIVVKKVTVASVMQQGRDIMHEINALAAAYSWIRCQHHNSTRRKWCQCRPIIANKIIIWI